MAEPTTQSLYDMAIGLQNRVRTMADLVAIMSNERPDLIPVLNRQIAEYDSAASLAKEMVGKYEANQIALANFNENAMLRQAFEAGDETIEYDAAAFNGAGAYRRKTGDVQ